MERILIVDDEDSVRAVLRGLLNSQGYEVSEAVNGKQALQSARELQPDAVIMDLRMPVMDGLIASRAFKKDSALKNIPIIVLTAYGESKAEAIEAGTDEFITKPFDAEEIVIRVKSMLRIRRLTRELQDTIARLNELGEKPGSAADETRACS